MRESATTTDAAREMMVVGEKERTGSLHAELSELRRGRYFKKRHKS